MCRSVGDIHSATAEIKRGKKKELLYNTSGFFQLSTFQRKQYNFD